MTARDHDSYSVSVGQLIAEVERLRASANRVLIESMRQVVLPSRPPDLSPDMERLTGLLETARVSMLENPSGARAIVSFLVEEGRRFAEGSSGQMWQNHLLAHPQLDYLRDLWEAVTLDLFDHVDEADSVPTAWIDLLTDALGTRSDIEALLDALRPDVSR